MRTSEVTGPPAVSGGVCCAAFLHGSVVAAREVQARHSPFLPLFATISFTLSLSSPRACIVVALAVSSPLQRDVVGFFLVHFWSRFGAVCYRSLGVLGWSLALRCIGVRRSFQRALGSVVLWPRHSFPCRSFRTDVLLASGVCYFCRCIYTLGVSWCSVWRFVYAGVVSRVLGIGCSSFWIFEQNGSRRLRGRCERRDRVSE